MWVMTNGLIRAGTKFNRKRFGGEMKRFERSATAPTAGASVVPMSVDFFGVARAAATAAKGVGAAKPGGAGGNAAKRARGADGQAQLKKDEQDSAQERPSDDSEANEVEGEGSDAEVEGGSVDEDEGVQLFSGGEMSKGDDDEDSGLKVVGKKGKRAAQKSVNAANAREELAVFRRQMRINVAGDEVPAPAGSFLEMRFPKEAGWLRNGIEAAGWKEPTPIQMQAVPTMMQGRDILACAPTGSGKTGAFVIPLFALLRVPKKAGIRGLIISPTRELATQIFQQCQLLRAHSKMECKLLTKATASSVADVQSSMGKKHDVLVSTPARVVLLLQQRALDLRLSTYVLGLSWNTLQLYLPFCVCVRLCLRLYLYPCLCLCLCVFLYVPLYIYVCSCVFLSVFLCVCMH